jgi:tetratricopeptide (TPR) repeat protein
MGMGRLLLVGLLLAGTIFGQLKERGEKGDPNAALVEEDEDIVAPTEYVFNPIQAKKDVKIGDFYAKKGSHRAAVGRYLEATKWNPSFAEAFWKLARSREKLDQPTQALDAYRKFVELEPDGKQGREAQKRIADIEAQREKLPMTQESAAEPQTGSTEAGSAETESAESGSAEAGSAKAAEEPRP